MADALSAWADALDDVEQQDEARLWLQLAFLFEALFPLVEAAAASPALVDVAGELIPIEVPVEPARDSIDALWTRAEGAEAKPARLPALSKAVMVLGLGVRTAVDAAAVAVVTQIWTAVMSDRGARLDAPSVMDVALPALDAVAELSPDFLGRVVEGYLTHLVARTLAVAEVDVDAARTDAKTFASALAHALEF